VELLKICRTTRRQLELLQGRRVVAVFGREFEFRVDHWVDEEGEEFSTAFGLRDRVAVVDERVFFDSQVFEEVAADFFPVDECLPGGHRRTSSGQHKVIRHERAS
jgi:hypothetical protein